MIFNKIINGKSHEKIHIDKKQNFVTHEDHADSKSMQPEKLIHEVNADKAPNIAINVNKTNKNVKKTNKNVNETNENVNETNKNVNKTKKNVNETNNNKRVQ